MKKDMRQSVVQIPTVQKIKITNLQSERKASNSNIERPTQFQRFFTSDFPEQLPKIDRFSHKKN